MLAISTSHITVTIIHVQCFPTKGPRNTVKASDLRGGINKNDEIRRKIANIPGNIAEFFPGSWQYSETSVHELNSFLKVVRKPKCS